MKLIGTLVVLLLIGPLLLILAVGLLLVLAAILPSAPRQVRQTFWCPWKRRMVMADFLVSEGAAHPSEVVRCTAFADPEQVTCKKQCRKLTEVRTELSRGTFPRWALIAGGTVTWREAQPAPRGDNDHPGSTTLAA